MVKSLVLFLKLQLVHSEWSFSRGQILFFLARIQEVHVARWLLYVCLHREKAWFLYFSRSLLISYSITLSLEKEIIVLEKSLEKVLNFGSKNLYEPNPDITYSETWKNHQEHKPNLCRNPWCLYHFTFFLWCIDSSLLHLQTSTCAYKHSDKVLHAVL